MDMKKGTREGHGKGGSDWWWGNMKTSEEEENNQGFFCWDPLACASLNACSRPDDEQVDMKNNLSLPNSWKVNSESGKSDKGNMWNFMAPWDMSKNSFPPQKKSSRMGSTKRKKPLQKGLPLSMLLTQRQDSKPSPMEQHYTVYAPISVPRREVDPNREKGNNIFTDTITSPQKSATESKEDSECPSIFILAEFGNVQAGIEHWRKTLEWRKEIGADDALEKPHPNFDICKKFYPHYFYGRDLAGNVIYVEKIGQVDVDGLKRHGLTAQDVLWHFMYNMEYLWTVLSPSYDDRMTMLLDASQLNFKNMMVGETKNFVKGLVSMASKHYPQRSEHIVIINAPSWFMMGFKLVKPLIHENTRKRITIVGSNYFEILRGLISTANIPKEYGGTGPCLEESVFEIQYREHVLRMLHSKRLHMNQVQEV